MRITDIPAGLRLCRLSDWNQVEDDWRSFLDSPHGGGHLAETDGAVLGTVTFLRYPPGFTWLAMMLVDPARRGSGVGTRLMEAALESLAAECCVRLDASPAGEPLYRRYGFIPEYELERASLMVTAGPVPAHGGSEPAVRPMEAHELLEVRDLDREIFGAERGALLASFYRRAPEMAWTARIGPRLAGYTFGRPGHLYHQLGPVAAIGEDVAEALVAHCLSGQSGRRIAVDVPAGARGWTEWLRAAGFRTERPFLRMRRGENPSGGAPGRQFAVAGPEFG
jgi:GNAT superfamily N-acetyltransferase